MINVKANRRICEGFGNCAVNAPDVFDLDDDDRVIVLRDAVDEADRDDLQEAIRSCPVSALSMAEGGNGAEQV